MVREGEVTSAVRRLEREKRVSPRQVHAAFTKLERLQCGWEEVPAVDAVIERAIRVLAFHALTFADALQLAAAIEFVADRPRNHRFVTTDLRLAEAAERNGFEVVSPGG
jgi:predicted nucleic acid-binding protein